MTLCDTELVPVMEAISVNFGWRCTARPGDSRVLISTGRRWADSEPVRLFARLADSETIMVSDGGETNGRLADLGFNREDTVMEAIWQEALRAYRLSELDGRVFAQVPLARAAHELSRFADALVALDALRIVALPAPSRPRTLADQVEDFLRGVYPGKETVRRSPEVHLQGGLVVRPALLVTAPQRPGVLVQPGSTSSKTQSYDHAYATFHLAARGGVPKPNRLVVLGGSVGSWNPARLRALSDLAYVGFFKDRERVRGFLDGHVPEDPLMVPEGVEVPMLHLSEPSSVL